jgi:hypothetical protein
LFKLALFRMQIKIVRLKAIEDFINNFMMFFKSTASNENVVKINSNLALSNKISED